MLADVGQRLIFPHEIATTNLRPDIILCSGSTSLVHLVELTVPWEDAVDEVYGRKKHWYTQLAAEAEQQPGESGFAQWRWVFRFVATPQPGFSDTGFSGQELRRIVKNLYEAATGSG
ncbi:UNVERIFIED_CONTAM: hypothetical protein FKN15_009083 [Acipenser sinensis]